MLVAHTKPRLPIMKKLLEQQEKDGLDLIAK